MSSFTPDLSSIEQSVYTLECRGSVLQDRQFFRYVLQSPNIPSYVVSAHEAVLKLLQNNPGLFSLPKNLSKEDVQKFPYLVINHKIVCLSDQPFGEGMINLQCRDVFFSLAMIVRPVQCCNNHVFEHKYIEAWKARGNLNCPCETPLHPIGSLEEDRFLTAKTVQRLKNEQRLLERNEKFQDDLQKVREQKQKTLQLLSALRNIEFLEETKDPVLQAYDGKISVSSLTRQEKLAFFKKLARMLPLKEIPLKLKSFSEGDLNEALKELGVNPLEIKQRIKKLFLTIKNFEQFEKSPQTLWKQAKEVIENVEDIIGFFLPSRKPSSPWEAQQMLTLIGAAVAGLAYAETLFGATALFYIPIMVGGYSYQRSKVLPSSVPYSTNLTLSSSVEASYPLIGRESVIEQIFQCWSATSSTVRQHPLLVGSSGVGKSAVIKEVSRLMKTASVLPIPDSLKNGYLYYSTAAELLPQMGEGDYKFQEVFKKLERFKENIVLSVDEVHSFFTESSKEIFGQIMKTKLDTTANGFPYMLFATTHGEYEQYIAHDPALARRFYVIKVNVLDKAHTIQALNQYLKIEKIGCSVDKEMFDYIYEKSQPLVAKSSRFEQPEVAKQLLSRALVKMRAGPIDDLPSKELLDQEKQKKTSELSVLATCDHLLQSEEAKVLSSIQRIDQKISDLEQQVAFEKQNFKAYQQTIQNMFEGMQILVQNFKGKELDTLLSSKEQTMLFSFLCYFFNPFVLEQKRFFEKKLKIKTLDKSIVDSVAEEMAASLYQTGNGAL